MDFKGSADKLSAKKGVHPIIDKIDSPLEMLHYSYDNFGEKSYGLHLPAEYHRERCISFPKYLDLALTPLKTHEGLRSSETPSNMIICGALSLV